MPKFYGLRAGNYHNSYRRLLEPVDYSYRAGPSVLDLINHLVFFVFPQRLFQAGHRCRLQ
jgi:hypothetical protein